MHNGSVVMPNLFPCLSLNLVPGKSKSHPVKYKVIVLYVYGLPTKQPNSTVSHRRQSFEASGSVVLINLFVISAVNNQSRCQADTFNCIGPI